MNDIDASRTTVRAAIAAAAAAREQAAIATERLAHLRRNTADRADMAAAIDRELENATAAQAAAAAAVREATAAERAALAAFVERTSVAGSAQDTSGMTNTLPVLLGPVRIETKFKGNDLLVRIFPDEWSIDAHEEDPTESEIAAVSAYWAGLWRAGGDQLAQRAAWRDLTGRINPGRAAWIVKDIHRPANPGDQPTGAPAGQTVLVVVSQQALPAADRQPTITYWSAVWRAHGDKAAITEADLGLLTAVGGRRAAAIRGRRPAGIDSATSVVGTDVSVVFLVLPPPTVPVKPESWTRAARARLLPDQFVVLGFQNGEQVLDGITSAVDDTLAVSPDPTATDQLKVGEDGVLHIPDDMKWMTDFERAKDVGMALRIPLNERTHDGVDRLLVLGLRLRSTPAQAKSELENLITRQLRSPAGFGFLPQGTPTNNTDSQSAGPAGEKAAAANAALRAAETIAGISAGSDWTTKTDGQWFADLLGLDAAILDGAPYADRTDQRDARAANTALWPATWGYFLETMLYPILPAGAVAETRDFFKKYVSGRGPIPAIRVGRQPYGILPTTAFSRLAWVDGAPHTAHRRKVNDLLATVAEDWAEFAQGVSHLDSPGDAHQRLLDILALNPSSVEFHHRYAKSVEDVYNEEMYERLSHKVLPALETLHLPERVRDLLTALGWGGGTDPDVIRRLYSEKQFPLLGPVVDDLPLSETSSLRAYATNNRDYLQWLVDGARGSLETIRLEKDFTGPPPTALLYLLARHAVLLGYHEAGQRLAAAAGSQTDSTPTREPLFIHISGKTQVSESRYRQLYSPDQAITGSPDQIVADFIPGVLGQREATRDLAEQITALDLLRGLPTAELERVLAEHLDCCTYRMDAWRLGLVNERLAELRYGPAGESAANPIKGLHLGAYGWLDGVHRRPVPLEPKTLPPDLAEIFTPAGSTPLLTDETNGGFIHAPSLSHATTAAVLRAGYLSNAHRDVPDALAVNLSSDRIRIARSFQQGLREGQPLGALLGYQFERGLHDRYEMAEVDRFISALRLVFPLVANRTPGTDPPAGTKVDSIEQIEARNVIDGLELVRRVTRADDEHAERRTYPFGFTGLPDADDNQKKAIKGEVDRLLNIHDALADLAVAESTHQALLGNPERAGANLDAYAKAGFPAEPAVTETPRSGITLTHRLGLQFRSGLPPRLLATPRAKAEPAVNDWLTNVLPSALSIGCLVTWKDPRSGDPDERVVTLSDLDLEPIDLLWTLRPADQEAMADLDDRIVGHVFTHEIMRADTELKLNYTTRIPRHVSFFELSPLIAAVRSLLTTARPLRPTDLSAPSGVDGVDRAADEAVSLSKDRPIAVQEALVEFREDLAEYVEDLAPLLEPAPNRIELLAHIDDFGERYAKLLSTACGFGLVRSGWGEITTWRCGLYREIVKTVLVATDRMAVNLATAGGLIDEYDDLPFSTDDETRFKLLQKIERMLTTTPANPRPSTPFRLRFAVGNLQDAFEDRLSGLVGATETIRSGLGDLVGLVRRNLPISDLDATGLDITPYEDRIIALTADLLARTRALDTEIGERLDQTRTHLEDYDKAALGPDRVVAAKSALKALIGEDVLAIEEFTPSDQLADEWREALRDSERGTTTRHLDRDFPVDDWMHGLARVREKPRLWERFILLGDALRDDGGLLGDDEDPALIPIQLPYREDDVWLGLEYPPSFRVDGDRVLYTAHYADSLSIFGDQCGLLLDEWTEVLPAPKETTGLTFHYDRPDTEPPQSMLLVTPPSQAGTSWNWDDLVAALHDTLELAKSRAVEPAQIDPSSYAMLLPATTLASTRQPITITTDLTRNNLGRTIDD